MLSVRRGVSATVARSLFSRLPIEIILYRALEFLQVLLTIINKFALKLTKIGYLSHGELKFFLNVAVKSVAVE